MAILAASSLSCRTTFLVPSLHCPSCASFIEAFLYSLRPKPVSVSASILSHTVTVQHDASLAVSAIAKALGEAGYGVHTTIPDPASGDASPQTNVSSLPGNGAQVRWLQRAAQRWKPSKRDAADEEARRKRHMEHCDQCRAQEQEDAQKALPSLQTTTSEKPSQDSRSQQGRRRRSTDQSANPRDDEDPFIVVHSTAATKIFQASISISGMSCSSCVGKITTALEEKPWVRSFGGEEHTEELVKIIDTVGYEANLERVDELPSPAGAGPRADADLWKASYAIGGMTCSSCVGTITKALESLPWIMSVDINLITNSATVVFEDKSHLGDIQTEVEAVGYDAKLDDVVNLSKSEPQNGRRTVSVRIDGMYCEHCPARVVEALDRFHRRVTVEKPANNGDPIIAIAYTPHSPDFTIRAILSTISEADPAFVPSIYHPPTLEERAKLMHARARQRIFYRVVLSVVVAIPAFIIGIVFMTLVPSSNAGRQYLMQRLRGVTRAEWALFIMATPVYFFATDVFHRRTLKELHSLWKPGSPVPLIRRFYRFGSMDMLMSFGTTIAYFSSIVELIIAATRASGMNMEGNATYFDSVVFLTMFLLIGRLIEAYSKAKTGDAVAMLGKLRPTEALLVPPSDSEGAVDCTQKIAVDLLEFGDVVRVLHGGSPPWDGILLEGESEFDESSLTGESRLVKKSVGDLVYSGTINKGGPLSIRTTGISGDSMLDQIIKVVREGQARRAPIERVADILTSYFVPVITLIAISTWLIWLGLGLSGTLPNEYLDVEVGGWAFWSLQFAIAVFIIACPCGIGLAAPTALFVGGGLAAKHGILVKGGGEAFQEASSLDCIVFDKTGTLTQGGEPKVTDSQFFNLEGCDWNDLRTLGALKELERNSSHPIAKSLVSFCESGMADGAKAIQIDEMAGKGMKGSFYVAALPHPVELIVGNEAFMADYSVIVTSAVSATLNSWKTQGKSIVVVAARTVRPGEPPSSAPWKPVAIFAVSDPLRPESAAVVKAIQRQGLDVWMISGDNPTTAHTIGDMVGIPREHIIAGVLPEQKADKIRYLQRSQVKSNSHSFFGLGRPRAHRRAVVAMVGDGVNDSPALTVADVGIAIGSGSDVAISAAEFVLIAPSLTTLLTLINLSRTVFRRVKFNFGWALVYNLVALPIAAGVLYPVRSGGQHVRLDPVWASLAMALSSISVICSSLLLRSGLPIVGFRDSKTLRSEA
ncbi:heavy metal translocatin [Zopfia rhizophila CBS 207.26]|uniref:Heavy metal translocatin n=1 Tax=Zopfia rhizophila CBS 207.26 TaxID=1314779 RepID=A0A6A6DH36_9PEZI|nr:heavy metal translocatin [Zopfia rhizophila CBS 207.26]